MLSKYNPLQFFVFSTRLHDVNTGYHLCGKTFRIKANNCLVAILLS